MPQRVFPERLGRAIDDGNEKRITEKHRAEAPGDKFQNHPLGNGHAPVEPESRRGDPGQHRGHGVILPVVGDQGVAHVKDIHEAEDREEHEDVDAEGREKVAGSRVPEDKTGG